MERVEGGAGCRGEREWEDVDEVFTVKIRSLNLRMVMAGSQRSFRDTLHGEGKRCHHKVHYKCIIPELRTFIS